jgi:hypothetical protein
MTLGNKRSLGVLRCDDTGRISDAVAAKELA